MKLFGTLRIFFALLLSLFISLNLPVVKVYADATDVVTQEHALKCASKVSKSLSAAKTAAGVCPDCEALKKGPLKQILKVKEYLNPLNVNVSQEDIKNVQDFISYESTQVDVNEFPTWAVYAGADKCGLTVAEVVLLRGYTATNYMPLNNALRGSNTSGISPKVWVSMVKIMNSGLAKVAPYSGTVYRGTHKIPAGVLAQHKTGKIIQFTSYLSTSSDHEIADIFGSEYRYVIKSKTGRSINPISGAHGEQEVLFAPMTRFKITEVEQDAKGTIFHLDEL